MNDFAVNPIHEARRAAFRKKQHESRDSINFAKLTEGQMRAVVELVKRKNLLNEPAPEPNGTRGIVIAGGGKYLAWAWVNCRWLRERGITHPIQLWYLGPKEMPDTSRKHFEALNVELVDAFEVRNEHWMRRFGGWELKHFCAARCPFDNVCFVDADCLLVADPETIWNDADYQRVGSLFFSDVNKCAKNEWAYFHASVPVPEVEMESGVFFWNRQKAWTGIRMTTWMLEHSDVWFNMLWGDKDVPYLAYETTKTPYLKSLERQWSGWGIQHSFNGNVIANHAMAYKRGESKSPDPLIDRYFEDWKVLT